MSWYAFKPYVPVAKRRSQAARFAANLAKKEKRDLAPIEIEGRQIAASFWGQAWCEHLESFSDFENRLPRGRTYVRNGSVIDLQMERGKVKALVSGSEVYKVTVDIATLPAAAWKRIRKECSSSIQSVMDLLQGKFDGKIMERLSVPNDGLFPRPQEIRMKCSCPDYATMCKHVAAVLYGVGARLDREPELLFVLRDVDHLDLIDQAANSDNLDQTLQAADNSTLADHELESIFGIELETATAKSPRKKAVAKTKSRPAKKSAKKVAGSKKSVSNKKPASRQKAALSRR